jgi:4a-hydroxytetrahydrobiopterin dehydratase
VDATHKDGTCIERRVVARPERILSGLAARACVPCRGGVPPLGNDQIAPLLAELGADWHVIERADEKRGSIKLLSCTYRFEDFVQAMQAALRIGEMAEEQQHHPDLHVSWGRLGVEIWTHKIGGLTESDFIFAAKCDVLMRSPSPAEAAE